MNREKNNIFLKNFIPVMMVIFVTLGVLAGCGDETTPEEAASMAMENTAPVAKMQMQGDEPEAAPVTEKSTEVASSEIEHAGKATYNSTCVACHGSGIPGIPQLGDVAAWAPRIKQGNATLYEHAITGYTGASGMPMPAKGGNLALADDAVKTAVDYMIVSSQGEVAAEGSAMKENTQMASTGNNDAGKATYESICVACHSSGIPNIPQLGDTAAWAPRIKQGNATLYEHAIVGYTGASGMPMPAKGGNPALSDDDVKAAVDYMVTGSQ